MNEDITPLLKGKQYKGLSKIEGPLIFVQNTHPIGWNEFVEVVSPSGEVRYGQVLESSKDVVCVQVFEGTESLTTDGTKVRFLLNEFSIPVSKNMLGRTFNALAQPIDGKGIFSYTIKKSVNGEPINPVSRIYPTNFVQTGVSTIDMLMTLVEGQKLPIFSLNGLPHDELASQIVRQAKIISNREDFAIVFAAMGIKHESAEFFKREFENSGRLDKVAFFMSLADDPSIERIITPKTALTLAEHLAFDLDMKVLVIMTDMTNYCESLREISSLRGEVPGRKGYPGYLYSNLAELYERAGRIKGKKGSLTQLPILSMPLDDITHPIPDLTGYITEGQIVFSRHVHQNGIYPPIDILPSLSRIMKDGIGEGMTRADHPNLANQIYASYAKANDIRNLSQVIGEEELSEIDKKYLEFADKFEKEFLNQSYNKERTIEETLNLAWKIISVLPKEELMRLTQKEIDIYYGK